MEEKNVKDIREIAITNSLTQTEKIQEYIKQTDSPYCFNCKKIWIHISFLNTQILLKKHLKAILKQYILQMIYSKAAYPFSFFLCS